MNASGDLRKCGWVCILSILCLCRAYAFIHSLPISWREWKDCSFWITVNIARCCIWLQLPKRYLSFPTKHGIKNQLLCMLLATCPSMFDRLFFLFFVFCFFFIVLPVLREMSGVNTFTSELFWMFITLFFCQEQNSKQHDWIDRACKGLLFRSRKHLEWYEEGIEFSQRFCRLVSQEAALESLYTMIQDACERVAQCPHIDDILFGSELLTVCNFRFRFPDSVLRYHLGCGVERSPKLETLSDIFLLKHFLCFFLNFPWKIRLYVCRAMWWKVKGKKRLWSLLAVPMDWVIHSIRFVCWYEIQSMPFLRRFSCGPMYALIVTVVCVGETVVLLNLVCFFPLFLFLFCLGRRLLLSLPLFDRGI